MRLTKEKLLAAWRIREQIFHDSVNQYILDRYKTIRSIFDSLSEYSVTFDDDSCYVNDKELHFKDGKDPSLDYLRVSMTI